MENIDRGQMLLDAAEFTLQKLRETRIMLRNIVDDFYTKREEIKELVSKGDLEMKGYDAALWEAIIAIHQVATTQNLPDVCIEELEAFTDDKIKKAQRFQELEEAEKKRQSSLRFKVV